MPTLYRRVRTMIGAAWDAARAADDELSKAETSASFPGWTLMSEQAVSGGTGKQEIAPTGQDTLRMYERNVWVFAILSAKATYIAGMPWHLMRRRKGTDEVITEHEAIDLLEYPAPKRTWRNICALMVAQLDLTGRCALEKGRDGESGPVTQLHPLFSQYLRVLIDGKQGISGFAYRPNDVETILPPEDVAYFHDMSPLSEFTGVGAMRPAWLTAQLDMHSRQWNANFFARGAHPDGVVMAEKQIAPAIRERIEADFMNRHKGTRKGRGVEILEQGMKFQEVGVTHRELQFEKLMHMDREELHAAFRVPPVISGLTDQTNYATASVQERLFRFNTGIPLLGMILETLNLDVLPDLDPTGELYYAVDFAALSTDEERTARMTYVTQGLAAKVLDENEGREHLGYKPREQADEKKSVTVFAYDLEGGIVTIDEARAAKGLPPHPNRKIGGLTVPEARIELGIMPASPGGFSGGAPSVPGAPRMPAAPTPPKPDEPGEEGQPGEPAAKRAGVNGNGQAKRRRIHPADFDEAVLIRRP